MQHSLTALYIASSQLIFLSMCCSIWQWNFSLCFMMTAQQCCFFLLMQLPSVKLSTFELWRVDHPSKSQRLILGFQLSRFWCHIRAFAFFNLYPDNSIVWSSCWQRDEILKSSSAQYLRLYCQFWIVSKRFRSTLCLCPLHIPRVDP